MPTQSSDAETSRDLESLSDSLEAHVTFSEYDGESQFPNGTAACVCTNAARLICELAGKGDVWGYRDEDNPGTVCGQFAGGHDVALIDGRFIVDYWIKWVACLAERSVFDLNNSEDSAEIQRLYGDQDKWSPLPSNTDDHALAETSPATP